MLELEFGYSSLMETFEGKDLSELINNFKIQFPDLSISVYDGVDSFLSGGRHSNNNFDNIKNKIIQSNEHKVPFVLVMSAGLIYDKLPLDKMTFEPEIFEFLERNGIEKGVNNAIVIGHDDLLKYINQNHPDLTTICSCIQMVDHKKFTSYEDKLKKYDLVVPLNQHTTFEFLKQYKAFANQFLVFFNLKCANSNLYDCFKDYTGFEIRQGITHGTLPEEISYQKNPIHNDRPEIDLLEEDFNFRNIIRSRIYDRAFDFCNSNNDLSNHLDDAIQIYKLGINKYKIPRCFPLTDKYMNHFNKFIDLIKSDLTKS